MTDPSSDSDDVTLTTDIPDAWPATRVATITSQAMGLVEEIQTALDDGADPDDVLERVGPVTVVERREVIDIRRSGEGFEVRVGEQRPEVRTDGGEDQNDDPLDRVVVGTTDEDEVEIEVATLDAEEFRGRLEAIADAAEAIETLASDTATLRRSGLRESDVVDLIYGRNVSLTKRDIKAALGALDDIASGSKQSDLLRRLVADLSDLTLSETDEVLGELRRLHERYPPDDPDVVTDGGRDLEERRVDALEEIGAQLRYQNAALCELIATVEHVGLANVGVEEPRSGSRSYKALQTALDDHDFTREEKADETGLGGFGREFR